MRDDATITIRVASPDGPLRPIEISARDLYDVFTGTVRGHAVHDLIPGEPPAMTISVERGFVTAAAQVHLP